MNTIRMADWKCSLPARAQSSTSGKSSQMRVGQMAGTARASLSPTSPFNRMSSGGCRWPPGDFYSGRQRRSLPEVAGGAQRRLERLEIHGRASRRPHLHQGSSPPGGTRMAGKKYSLRRATATSGRSGRRRPTVAGAAGSNRASRPPGSGPLIASAWEAMRMAARNCSSWAAMMRSGTSGR